MAVPNVPGVPPLSSYAVNSIVLLTADVIGALLGFFSAPIWGIYLNGTPVIEADSQIDFAYKQDSPISTYPVEQGQFQSYDKVQMPAEIRCRFSAGGTESNRQNFLQSIEGIFNTIDLFDVVTPEAVYTNYNFTHRDWDRTADKGVGLIVVDLWLTEVRQTATAQYQNTQNPANAGQQGQGAVPTEQPSADTSSLIQPGSVT
jgi:hypothetical protein